MVFPIIFLGIMNLLFDRKNAFKYSAIVFFLSNILLLTYLINIYVSLLINLLLIFILFLYTYSKLKRKFKKGASNHLLNKAMQRYSLYGIIYNAILIILIIAFEG